MGFSNRDRAFSGRSEPLPTRIHITAESMVIDSLRKRGLPANIVARCDDYGPRVDVEVTPKYLESALDWQARVGRSYGPVRIFVVEAQ